MQAIYNNGGGGECCATEKIMNYIFSCPFYSVYLIYITLNNEIYIT